MDKEDIDESMNMEMNIKMPGFLYTSLEELAEEWDCTKEILALRFMAFGYDHVVSGQKWGPDYAAFPYDIDNTLQFPRRRGKE